MPEEFIDADRGRGEKMFRRYESGGKAAGGIEMPDSDQEAELIVGRRRQAEWSGDLAEVAIIRQSDRRRHKRLNDHNRAKARKSNPFKRAHSKDYTLRP